MEKLAIGKIRKAFGIHGHIKVLSFSGELDHWFSLEEVELRLDNRARVFKIEKVRLNGEDLLIKFQGLDTPEAARAFNGWEIYVDRDKAAPLGDGEVYLSDLIGLQLMYQGEKMGEVMGYFDGNQSPLIEIRTLDDKKVLVPYMEMYLGEIDFSQGTLELKVDWILQ